jgi:hypothetical protein
MLHIETFQDVCGNSLTALASDKKAEDSALFTSSLGSEACHLRKSTPDDCSRCECGSRKLAAKSPSF